MTGIGDLFTTEDVFLGGKLAVLQPAGGYRAGLDPVLLAAAAPVEHGSMQRVLDAGAGVGVVGLAVAARVADARVTLVEMAPALVDLGRRNVMLNAMSARVEVIEADVTWPARRLAAAGLVPETFDHVLANPPYLEESRGRLPPDPLKAQANAMADGGLERWLRFLARMARPGGTATLIHRADALGTLLDAIGARFGGIEVIPVHPRANEPAHRIIVRGRKGSRAPLSLRPGLVLHGQGSAFLPGIDAVLRRGEPLQVE